MLKINVKKILLMRGIQRMSGYLMNLGMSYPLAKSFLESSNKSIKFEYLEILCLALNCTPNDLFEWKQDANTVVAENHRLHTLDSDAETKSLQQIVKDIPTDKLKLIESLLEELKR